MNVCALESKYCVYISTVCTFMKYIFVYCKYALMMGSLNLNRLNSFLTSPYHEETESKFLRIVDFLGITSDNRTNLIKTVNNIL